MFVLIKISDVVQIDPWDFRKPSAHAIEDNLHAKYANKVIQGIGLCICVWDLLKVSEGLVSQGSGEGKVNVNAEFRLVVFRPFKGEILQGVMLDSQPDGIRLSLDFFTDVWIPAANLFEGSKFKLTDEGEHVWVWTADSGDEFYFDRSEPVRFRVEEEVWFDHTPQKPKVRDDGAENGVDGDMSEDSSTASALSRKNVPYTIIGSMTQPGLGLIYWWEDGGQDGEPEAEEN